MDILSLSCTCRTEVVCVCVCVCVCVDETPHCAPNVQLYGIISGLGSGEDG